MKSSFSVHGVSFSLTTNKREVLAFAKKYWLGFTDENPYSEAFSVNIDFRRGFSLHAHPSITRKPDEIALGSNRFLDPEKKILRVQDKDWYIELDFKNKMIGTLVFKRNIFRHTANIIFTKHDLREQYARAALRILPEVLLFLSLREKHIGVYSGAAYVKNKKAYLFPGLPGSGKSTLTKLLTKEFGGNIATENFVLSDGKNLFPYPEGNPGVSLLPIPIENIHLLRHGAHFAIQDIPPEQSIETIDTLTAETPAHSSLSCLWIDQSSPWTPVPPITFTQPAHILTTDIGFDETKKYFAKMLS